MAYRRKPPSVLGRSPTFKGDQSGSPSSPSPQPQGGGGDGDGDDDDDKKTSSPKASSLAARATRASAAHRDSSAYAYAYASPAADSPPSSSPYHHRRHSEPHHHHQHHHRSLSFYKDREKEREREKEKGSNGTDAKDGFWGVLARKAKSILDEEDQHHNHNHIPPSSSSHQGGGRPMMGPNKNTPDIIQQTRIKTADFIHETPKLQLRSRRPPISDEATVVHNTSWQRPVLQPLHTNQETQLKASRDVAMATAAKAKLLLRELKTVKADLAFAKERCSQLEEENKRLRDSRGKGDNPADDDLIRLQLETLLAEKARLAHENSIYARENRFLREIVEYHQLTMQDVVILDEGAEEFTEVYPFSIDDTKVLSDAPTSPYSPIYPSFRPEVASLSFLPEINEHKREAPEEEFNVSSAFSSPSSPPTIYPTSYLPERIESQELQLDHN